MKKNKLLQEYIEKVVKEELKHNEILEEDLKAAFVDPLTDIFKTALYGIKDMGVRVKNTVKTLVKGLPTLFVPFLDYDYNHIKEEEKEELDKLKEKYQDVLDKNNAGFVGTDLQPLAFLLNPSGFLGTKLVKASPVGGLAILKTIQVLTGGTSEVVNNIVNKWTKTFQLDKPRTSSSAHRTGSENDTWGGYGTGGYGYGSWDQGNVDYGSGMGDYGQLNEQQQFPDEMKKDIVSLLNNKELFSNNPNIEQMGKDVMGVYLTHISKFMSSKNYDDLINKNRDMLSKIDAEVQNIIKQTTDKEEIEKIKNLALIDIKKTYKDYYINKINQLSTNYPHISNAANKAILQIKKMN